MSSITLHHLNLSRSNRLFWALEELNLPYDVKVHFRTPALLAPDSLKEVNPLGKSPALVLDGQALTESSFIIHKLLSLPEVREAAQKGEIAVQVPQSDGDVFWSHFAEGSQLNIFTAIAYLAMTAPAFVNGGPGVPELNEDEKKGVQKYEDWAQSILKPKFQETISFAESQLAKQDSPFFSNTDKPGEGDFIMYYNIDYLLAGPEKTMGLFDGYTIGPNLRKWHETVLARPACQRALKREAEEEAKAKKE
ncbi:hypothetical protein B9479_003004 [Cryptococcus floricola]|uniref:GST N-terminal domain-containing protein n=1 Tax=Cryptococcus floricola TaxID=2591691 RepID=A0A5D3B259_9TREE|nr:hypothetical protein B9479_003004 [Cryptococcus floricola]